MLNNTWKIPIGDWSDDGHGKCDWFIIKSNFTVEEAREAYFKAVKESGINLSEDIASEYEDSSVSGYMMDHFPAFVENLYENGLLENWSEDEEPEYHVESAESMAKIVCIFIKRYTPEFEYKIVENSIPMLPFYGYDENNRHIGQFGYGLFY